MRTLDLPYVCVYLSMLSFDFDDRLLRAYPWTDDKSLTDYIFVVDRDQLEIVLSFFHNISGTFCQQFDSFVDDKNLAPLTSLYAFASSGVDMHTTAKKICREVKQLCCNGRTVTKTRLQSCNVSHHTLSRLIYLLCVEYPTYFDGVVIDKLKISGLEINPDYDPHKYFAQYRRYYQRYIRYDGGVYILISNTLNHIENQTILSRLLAAVSYQYTYTHPKKENVNHEK